MYFVMKKNHHACEICLNILQIFKHWSTIRRILWIKLCGNVFTIWKCQCYSSVAKMLKSWRISLNKMWNYFFLIRFFHRMMHTPKKRGTKLRILFRKRGASSEASFKPEAITLVNPTTLGNARRSFTFTVGLTKCYLHNTGTQAEKVVFLHKRISTNVR